MHNMLSLHLIFALYFSMANAAGPLTAETVFVTDDKFKSYRLEDFFWTGSGDGPVVEDSFGNETGVNEQDAETESWRTTTVFHTTTILFATLYPSEAGEAGCGHSGCTPQISPVLTESIDFSSPASTAVHIEPTPTQPQPRTALPDAAVPSQAPIPSGTVQPGIEAFTTTSGLEIAELTTASSSAPPEERYWLLTVLRVEEGPELRTNVLEDRLGRLYQRAFMRRRREDTGQVRVWIHNATATGSGVLAQRDVGLVYTVSVAGQLVAATAAAADMRLLTLAEVSAELGYPVLTKADPFLKEAVPFGARVKGRTRDTWLLIGSVVAAVSLLIVLAALFTLGLSKKRTLRSARGAANRRQVYSGEEGQNNLSFVEDHLPKDSSRSGRPGDPAVTFADQRRGSTSSSSCSGSSETSLVRLRMQQKRRDMWRDEPKPKPRPRTKLTRVQDADIVREGDLAIGGSRESIIDADLESIRGVSPNKASTPTSYLSMPSVKAFPRKARIPEPLNRVLEPISIRHLDEDDEDGPVEARNQNVKVTRHGSLEGEDPGIIGPVVWDRHCQHLNAIKDEAEVEGNIGRMRRRFSQLLDETFNPSSQQHAVAEDTSRRPDARAKSAVFKFESSYTNSFTRPKTTDSKRPATAAARTPRGAWTTPHCSTPNRPLSAGVFNIPPGSYKNAMAPTVDPQMILVDSELSPNDPAVPLIAAIKEELKRFRKPDSS